MKIIGISAFYHDSAAALLIDGKLIAAAQEERFTRKRHDSAFPAASIQYCLDSAGTELRNIDAIVFYDKPLLKFDRILQTYFACAPKGFRSFATAMPVWLKEKLFLKSLLKNELSKLGIGKNTLPQLLFAQHHQSHAASAFFPSPFESAAVLCLDGVGEWATTSVWHGRGNKLEPVWEQRFPHSLGLLYSAFTYYTGFKVNSGEYKLMGLAPYGEPRFVETILQHLIDVKTDGTFRLNMDYFGFLTDLRMTNRKFDQLFGGPPRKPESQLTQREMDLASSIQVVTEKVILKLGRSIRKELGERNLCLAGGVALNCVANGKLLRDGQFDGIWIQPAAGDAGGAVGAAYAAWHDHFDGARSKPSADSMSGSFLGPSLESDSLRVYLDRIGAKYQVCDEPTLIDEVARLLDQGKVIGWSQGRMEFGPRSLGGRSILGDPRNEQMQSTMNLKIKHRESFRPFAPAVLAEDVSKHFEIDRSSPYMLLVAPIHKDHRLECADQDLFGIEKLKARRSDLPAVTHVDHSARIQTVHADTNPRFHKLIQAYKEKTGIGVLINTSFNVRGEPIVCNAEDAYRCFMRTEIDVLVLENILLLKQDQPVHEDSTDWRSEFALD